MNLKRKTSINQDIQKNYYHYKNGIGLLSDQVYGVLPNTDRRPIVIVCIGTDRSTGDALGPIVGSKMDLIASSLYDVYGTLEKPVHAVNLEEQLKEILFQYVNPFIIAVDASLGKASNIGMITFGRGPVMPGAGVKKQLPPVGNAHLTGIVNVSGFMEYFVLQNTRLNLVMKMADTISESIFSACKKKKFILKDQVNYQ